MVDSVGPVRDVDQVAAQPIASAAGLPYRPGPISLLVARIDALGWRSVVVYVALPVALFSWGHVVLWYGGRLAPGTIDPNIVIVVPYAAYALAAIAIGRRIARGAVESFWPATGWPETEKADWRYLFTYAPSRFEIVTIALGLVISIGTLVGSPASILGPEASRAVAYIAYLPGFVLGYVPATTLLGMIIRWVRLVWRIHRDAGAIDPFDRRSIYSFSRLTAFIGLVVVLADFYNFTFNVGFQAGNLVAITFGVLSTVLGVVAFVAPLWGLHDRLVDLKEAQLRDVERRISGLGARIYATVEAGAFDQGKAMNDSLDGLTTLRERIVHLPTWPWAPQLFRGFITALVLPIVIYILSRTIGGVIGA